MFLVRTLVVCSVALSLFLTTSMADAAKPKAGKKKHAVHGVVTTAADGTFSVKVHVGKKKQAAGTESSEKTFSVSTSTKFIKVTGKKADRKEEDATKDDLKVGSHVLVVTDKEGKAEKVSILPGKAAKKKKNV